MLAPETILQGRYRIVRQLGQGGMGAVYEAVDQRLDTTVALKETLFADERLRKQFEREARLLARLHHPALPRVSDHFSEGDGQFLVMQFIPGDDLSEMMARKRAPFPAHQVLTWADQLLDALDYLHTQDPQIIHRDIKPQNLKLTSRGQIILLDFGLAKGQAGDISRVTTAASIFGYTPNYAPLEQIQGLGTDSRSDLYALGATLYHLITGVKPPDALTRAAALVNGQPDPLQPASEANTAISPEVDAMLAKAMSQSRDQRYATAAEMREALHGSEQGTTVSNRGEAQTVLLPSTAGTVSGTTQLESRQKTVATGETTVVRQVAKVTKGQVLPWLVSAATVLVVACVAYAFYAYRVRDKSAERIVANPTGESPASSVSPAVATSTGAATPEAKATAPTVTATPAQTGEQSTARKEKQKAVEEKKRSAPTETPNPVPEPPSPHQQRAVEEPNVPDPDVGGPNRPKRKPPTTRVMPGGVIIRNFPDGSQMITTPDGTRVFIDKNGKRQVFRPGEKFNRRNVPPTP